MYYDRIVDDSLLSLLTPGGGLAWLVAWLRGPQAAASGAHLQFRRARGARRHGGLQVYVGRTSPMEVRVASPVDGLYTLHAHARYEGMSPDLFGYGRPGSMLADQQPDLEAHLEAVAAAADSALVGGEAVAQAGMLRRYGPLAGSADPFVIVDSEARMGFSSKVEREAFAGRLRADLGPLASGSLPTKLDVVGVDPGGRLLLVEVKDRGGDLRRAVCQAAVHAARFQALLTEQPRWGHRVLTTMLQQRAAAGLLGDAEPPDVAEPLEIVPVVAAPEGPGGWTAAWRGVVDGLRGRSGSHLAGLRLWRLSPDGTVLEDVAA